MLSMLRSSLVSEGTNPITQHYRLVRLVGGAGQEMVWKIYEAFRIKDGKVSSRPTSKCLTLSCIKSSLRTVTP